MAVFEQKSKYLVIIKFLIYALFTSGSEAVCESWGFVINSLMLKKPTANDGPGIPPGYKNARKFLQVALINMECPTESNVTNKSVTSEVILKAVQNVSNCLSCFNWKYLINAILINI